MAMKGTSINLEPVTSDEDCELLARWASSTAGTYASGGRAFVTTAEFRESLGASPTTFLMVRTHQGRAVGAVTWQHLEHSGSFLIGVMIGDPDLWGAGLGVESVSLLIEYLFHSCNAHRVQFICGSYNKPMIEIACSSLIRVEGVLRDYYFLDGAYHDGVIGAILRDDYYSARCGPGLRPSDVVPETDKAEARKILSGYLAENPITLADLFKTRSRACWQLAATGVLNESVDEETRRP
ncbi:MAG TPA: GNAT family protein [Streptosporangiaceae bacterium]|jgi:RimJ/RimL family protein N-acetyltransferase